MNAHAILLKYPAPGFVKTRLARDIGDKDAAVVYKRLVEKLLTQKSKEYDTLLFIEPYTRVDDFKTWLGEQMFFSQRGACLGERMTNAFRDIFDKGYQSCILTGSDIPELSCEIISDGFKELEDHGTVIGEADDGGYYLIGFKKDMFTDRIFKGFTWSTNLVFINTISIFESMGYKPGRTEKLKDMDTEADLQFFRENCIIDF